MKRAVQWALIASLTVLWYLPWFACSETKEYARAGAHAVIDCAKADLPAIVALLADWGAKAALAGKVDWTTVEDGAKHKGVSVGSCAVAAFLAAVRKQPEPQVVALMGAPDTAVEGEAVLARVSGGAEVRLP